MSRIAENCSRLLLEKLPGSLKIASDILKNRNKVRPIVTVFNTSNTNAIPSLNGEYGIIRAVYKSSGVGTLRMTLDGSNPTGSLDMELGSGLTKLDLHNVQLGLIRLKSSAAGHQYWIAVEAYI